MTILDGAIAIVVSKAKILLIKRSCVPYKGYWALPGGGKEQDETFEEAAIREVKEEVGIDIKIVKRFEEMSMEKDHVVAFIGKVVNLDFKLQKAEISDFKFVDLRNLIQREIVPSHYDLLIKLRENEQNLFY